MKQTIEEVLNDTEEFVCDWKNWDKEDPFNWELLKGSIYVIKEYFRELSCRASNLNSEAIKSPSNTEVAQPPQNLLN